MFKLKSFCSFEIFLKILLLFYIFWLPLNQATGNDCYKCIQTGGKSCDEFVKRYGKTKYWVLKGGRTLSFSRAADACRQFGFVIGEINSESDDKEFHQLVQADGYYRYWVGLVLSPNEKGRIEMTKEDGVTKPPYHPPVVLSWDMSKLEKGTRAVSMDKFGSWYSNMADERNKFGVVCQFKPGTECYKQAVSDNSGNMRALASKSSSDCDEPEFGDQNQLIQTGHNSKYLYPKTIVKTTPLEANILCEKAGLETASVENIADWKHLIFHWVYTKRLFVPGSNLIFSASLAQRDSKGFEGFYDSMKFQQFNLDKRHYFLRGGSCLSLHCNRTCSFHPIRCGSITSSSDSKDEPLVVPLCQYKKQSPCFKKTPLALYDRDEKDDLILIGSSGKRRYYGSRKQKTWEDALGYCTTHGKKKLLSFSLNETHEVASLLDIVRNYRQILGVSWFTGSIWTSGKFEWGYAPEAKFTFQSNPGEIWSHKEGGKHWQWKDKLVKMEKEICMVLVGADSNQGIRPIMCDLPNYFVCWEETKKRKNVTDERRTTGKTEETNNESKVSHSKPPYMTATELKDAEHSNAEEIQNMIDISKEKNDNLVTRTKVIQPLNLVTRTKVVEPKKEVFEKEQHDAEMKEQNLKSQCGDIVNISFSDMGLTNQEILDLIELSLDLKFSKGYSDLLEINDNSKWRAPHVKAMGIITKKLCGTNHVVPEFVNMLMNYIMIYYNSIAEKAQSSETAALWLAILFDYETCINDIIPLEFEARGGILQNFIGDEKTSEPIDIKGEKADALLQLDYIMEGFWYMFQATAAACGGPSQWLANYFFAFRNAFTEPLKDWWVNPGVTNYGVLFGDLDLSQNLYNLRACGNAGFQKLQRTYDLPIRPINVRNTNFLLQDTNLRLIK